MFSNEAVLNRTFLFVFKNNIDSAMSFIKQSVGAECYTLYFTVL